MNVLDDPASREVFDSKVCTEPCSLLTSNTTVQYVTESQSTGVRTGACPVLSKNSIFGQGTAGIAHPPVWTPDRSSLTFTTVCGLSVTSVSEMRYHVWRYFA
jgi:hypothetical protein